MIGTNPLKTVMDGLRPNGYSLGRVADAKIAKGILQALLDEGWAPPEMVGAMVVEVGGQVLISERELARYYKIELFIDNIGRVIIRAKIKPQTIQGTIVQPKESTNE